MSESPRVPLWIAVPLILAMVAVAAGLGWLVLSDQDSTSVPAATSDPTPDPTEPRVDESTASSPAPPSDWDDRIEPLVRITEEQRGLEFAHPVTVNFLSRKKFTERFRGAQSELTDSEEEEAESFVGTLRSLGLVTGDFDLLDAVGGVLGNTTLAYYEFATRSINVRGQRITEATKATVVHELTHALQDQHFHVGELRKELSEATDGFQDSRREILDAVVEGDAQRTESLYEATLSEEERTALEGMRRDESDEAMAAIEDIPEIVATMFAAPYVLGEGFVTAVAMEGGNAAVDALLRDIPTRDVVLLDPLAHLQGGGDGQEATVPQLPEGAEETYTGGFGVVWWYLMLAERMPAKDALAAVAGIEGDAMLAYTREGRSCVKLAARSGTGEESGRLEAALGTWAAATPEVDEQVSATPEEVRLEACDPGSQAGVGRDKSMEALTLVGVRSAIGSGMLDLGVPVSTARCIAQAMVARYSVDQLSSSTEWADDPALQSGVVEIFRTCGYGGPA